MTEKRKLESGGLIKGIVIKRDPQMACCWMRRTWPINCVSITGWDKGFSYLGSTQSLANPLIHSGARWFGQK